MAIEGTTLDTLVGESILRENNIQFQPGSVSTDFSLEREVFDEPAYGEIVRLEITYKKRGGGSESVWEVKMSGGDFSNFLYSTVITDMDINYS